ncbi:MAG: hypothetical protein GY953_53040, partial [bacterium]|nr:hypothetical protein [bacterium]
NARRTRPDDPVVGDTLAWVYLQRDMPRSAVSILEDIVEQRPRNALFRYHLSLALDGTGMTARAREEREVALRLDPSVEQNVRLRTQ